MTFFFFLVKEERFSNYSSLLIHDIISIVTGLFFRPVSSFRFLLIAASFQKSAKLQKKNKNVPIKDSICHQKNITNIYAI